jgi:TonB family protein
MRRLPAAFLLFAFAAASTQGGDPLRKEANKILAKARALETFQISDHPRYLHDIHFILHPTGAAEIPGDSKLEAELPSSSREEVNFDNYRFLQIRVGHHVWTKSTHDFTPLVVEELRIALTASQVRIAEKQDVKRIYGREVNGAGSHCIVFETTFGSDRIENEICASNETGAVVYARHGRTEAILSGFYPFGAAIMPRRIVIDLPDKGTIVADSNYDDVERFDPADFKPIDGVEVGEVCKKSSRPVAIYTPDPAYPLMFMGKAGIYRGKVTGVVKVNSDGTVLNAAVVNSLDTLLDRAALEAVRKWNYKPGTCNGKPVNSVTQFEVVYQ